MTIASEFYSYWVPKFSYDTQKIYTTNCSTPSNDLVNVKIKFSVRLLPLANSNYFSEKKINSWLKSTINRSFGCCITLYCSVFKKKKK